MPGKLGRHHQQARVTAGQNLEWPDFARSSRPPAHDLPEAPAILGVQRFQSDDAEHLEEGLVRFVQRAEPAGGGGQQDDLRLRLQHFAELPAEFVVGIPAQRLHVLDNKDKSSAQPVRGSQYGGAGLRFRDLFAPARRQCGSGVAQFPGELGVVLIDFVGQVEHRLQPEVGETENLLALFHEPYRQQRSGEVPVTAQFGGDPDKKHGLPPSSRADYEDVLAGGRRDVVPQLLQQKIQLVTANHELLLDLFIRLEQPGVELADGGAGLVAHRSHRMPQENTQRFRCQRFRCVLSGQSLAIADRDL